MWVHDLLSFLHLCVRLYLCVCVFIVSLHFFRLKDERKQPLSLLPKTTSKPFHLAGIYNASIEHECVIFNVFLRASLWSEWFDSNEFAYANTSRSQSFQSVQLRVEGHTQNGTNNGTPFIPRVWLILEPILKINKFNVVI